MKRVPDVTVMGRPGDTVWLLRADSERAISWVDEHIGRENGYQPLWPTVVVEARYVGDIIDAMTADGLVLK